jgi:MFS family permease
VILGAYRSVVRERGFPRLVLAVNLARLPMAVIPLAEVLLVRRRTGSFVDAGVVTAAWALASGVLAPFQGRLVDRHGQPRVLIPCAALCAVALGGFVTAALNDAPTAVLAVLSACAGGAFPPVGASMRNLWKTRLSGDQSRLGAAYSFESVVVELVFVLGPALCALIVAVASPQAALVGAAVAVVVGTTWMATSRVSRSWPSGPSAAGAAGAIGDRGLRTLAFLTVPLGAALGTLDIGLPAFARAHGHPAAAGLLLTAFAVGSMAGGLWFGSRRWSAEGLYRRFVIVALAFTVGLLPLAAASSLAVMAPLAALAGTAFAPAVVCMYLLVDRVAPPGTLTEAYTWVLTATAAGQALGAGIAGVVAQHVGVRAGLLVASGAALLGVVIAVARRRTLEREAAAAEPGPGSAAPAAGSPAAVAEPGPTAPAAATGIDRRRAPTA